MILLLACAGTPTPDDGDVFGSDPRVDDTAVIPPATLVVSDGVVVDRDEDGWWQPGEDAEVQVTLTNGGSEEFPYYPGVVLTVDNADVVLENDDWYLYSLAAGESTTARFQATAAATIADETTVQFTATVDVLGCEDDSCPEAEALVFDVVVAIPPEDTAAPD